jgi:hypothetical protein
MTTAKQIASIRKKLAVANKKIDAIRASMQPLMKKLDAFTEQQRKEEECKARLAEIARVRPRWDAFVAGRAKYVFVSQRGDVKRARVKPLFRAGDWIVHEAIHNDADIWPKYALTHGPTGMAADRDDTIEWLQAKAQRLAKEAPDFDASAPVTSDATERVRAIVGPR